jgi:hypothetical protein
MQKLIDDVNFYLRRNNIKDESDPAFQVVMWSLLEQHLYQGFNYFKLKKIGNDEFPVLAGSSTDFEFLQLY